MFFVDLNIDTSTTDVNRDLEKLSYGAFLWKITFDPDPVNRFKKKIFRRKKTVSTDAVVYFNDTPVYWTTTQKYLSLN